MTSRRAKLDTKFTYNTLSCVVKALEGEYTTIDLRNESCVTGKISAVDGFMNVELEDVVFYDPRGNLHAFDTFYIHNRNIRHVHIPKEFSSVELAEKLFGSMSAPRLPLKNKKKSFKVKRAEQYQQETLNSLQNPMES